MLSCLSERRVDNKLLEALKSFSNDNRKTTEALSVRKDCQSRERSMGSQHSTEPVITNGFVVLAMTGTVVGVAFVCARQCLAAVVAWAHCLHAGCLGTTR